MTTEQIIEYLKHRKSMHLGDAMKERMYALDHQHRADAVHDCICGIRAMLKRERLRAEKARQP